MNVLRCYTEKQKGFDIEANAVLYQLREFLGVRGLESVRILNRYDVEGISEEIYKAARCTVFSEPQTDDFYDEYPPGFEKNCRTLNIEPVPGQYDQRADACEQCLQMLSVSALGRDVVSIREHGAAHPDTSLLSPLSSLLSTSPITVKTAKAYVFSGDVSDDEMEKIRSYLINPLETRAAADEKPETLIIKYPKPDPVETVRGFISAREDDLLGYQAAFSLAMDMGDLRFMQTYFRDTEKRDPTVTELRLIDTYWSDHCRHTTFNTHITGVSIDDPDVGAAYESYLAARREAYGEEADARPQTLMDIATIAAKVLRGRGLLENIDISEEVNACSIRIGAEVDGKTEDWLLMFKNETHNHPTEVEPFGGAATCVGGAIRDPLSGRAYIYQTMRVTGSGDPRAAFEDTIPGKLPQRKLTTTAARGYSSYGNQIGVASGLVHEIYHPGYIAKRMELGAVVGAVKAENVVRGVPAPGDKVILLGGRTGRDGIGGATGSSKPQTTESFTEMASEVQKGNAVEERKIQRMILDPEVTKIIKRCNDFGAGGVSVAVGELADGLDIDLSSVRLKYQGLDGTEIALSESQERMAIVTAPENAGKLIEKAGYENLEAYVIAEVTKEPRLVMRHEGTVIVDISREFLSTNGAVKETAVRVGPETVGEDRGEANGEANGEERGERREEGVADGSFVCGAADAAASADRLRALVRDLRFCSQRGLYEMFDGTAGASGVLMKNGGRTQSAPVQAMASLLPAFDAGSATTTCSVMAFGFDPYLSTANPFTGAKTAVITSVAKLVASGCDPDRVYLSFQEYFERLRNDPVRWGKPFSALLGAFEAQMGLELAAIGGKDSMSGSFNDLDAPPTLVSFAIAPNEAGNVISPEFKEHGRSVVVFAPDNDLRAMKQTWRNIRSLIADKTIVSAWAITEGGAAEGIFKMSLGNEIGFECFSQPGPDFLFEYSPGAIIAEVTRPVSCAVPIGRTIPEPLIRFGGKVLNIMDLKADWEDVLEDIFPTEPRAEGINLTDDSAAPRRAHYAADSGQGAANAGDNNSKTKVQAAIAETIPEISFDVRHVITASEKFAAPRALILTFPGTNGEIDAARAVSRAGGKPNIIVVRNLTAEMLKQSLFESARAISESQIVIIPGGSSLGDEPDGPAKFIDAFFRNPVISDAIHEHLKTRDGLILGLGNGFQALIKLGLVPFGEIVPPDGGIPALTGNLIGRHQAGYAYTRVASVNSPWMSLCSVGEVYAAAISHSSGRFIAPEDTIARLAESGRIATQYTDSDGKPSMAASVNPNGSAMAVEGLFSPDGRVFGKMGHSERYGRHVALNIYGDKRQPIFESGINYFK